MSSASTVLRGECLVKGASTLLFAASHLLQSNAKQWGRKAMGTVLFATSHLAISASFKGWLVFYDVFINLPFHSIPHFFKTFLATCTGIILLPNTNRRNHSPFVYLLIRFLRVFFSDCSNLIMLTVKNSIIVGQSSSLNTLTSFFR